MVPHLVCPSISCVYLFLTSEQKYTEALIYNHSDLFLLSVWRPKNCHSDEMEKEILSSEVYSWSWQATNGNVSVVCLSLDCKLFKAQTTAKLTFIQLTAGSRLQQPRSWSWKKNELSLGHTGAIITIIMVLFVYFFCYTKLYKSSQNKKQRLCLPVRALCLYRLLTLRHKQDILN